MRIVVSSERLASYLTTKSDYPRRVVAAAVITVIAAGILAYMMDSRTIIRLGHTTYVFHASYMFLAAVVVLGINLVFVTLIQKRQYSDERAAGLEQQLHAIRFARFDPVTGLASVHLLHEKIGARLVKGEPACLFLVWIAATPSKNVDLPKLDREQDIVMPVAARLLSLSGGNRENIARMTNDTFAFLLETDEPAQVEAMALRCTRTMSRPYEVLDRSFDIPSKLGIALSPANALTTDELIRCANHALQTAISDTNALWRYYHPVTEAAEQRAQKLRRELPGAISRGQITAYYQPIVELKSQRCVKLEVLARWNHPTLGIITPIHFIPLAEEMDLTDAITELLVDQVADEARHFPPDVIFAFNVSPGQLHCMAKYASQTTPGGFKRLPPARMEIEITEESLIKNIDQAREVMRTVQAAGMKVALDDFGIGYSNFGQLAELPFDSFKIDRKFVAAMEHDSRAAGCVTAMIATGRTLGLEIVAEGIEDDSTRRALIALGCRLGQGYLFGRPQPAVPAARPPATAPRSPDSEDPEAGTPASEALAGPAFAVAGPLSARPRLRVVTASST